MSTSVGADILRSPFENVLNFVPEGHEKALKHAFYNSLALLLLVVCGAAGWAVYYVLEPFIKPLLWAVLCGSVLHPFKHRIATWTRKWLQNLDSNSTPLFVGVMMMPVQVIDDTSERVGGFITKYLKIILAACVILPCLHVVYYYTPRFIVCLVQRLGIISFTVIGTFITTIGPSVILALVVGYLIVLATYWKPEKSNEFSLASTCVWITIASYLAAFMGPLQIPAFFVFVVFFALGFGMEVWQTYDTSCQLGTPLTLMESVKIAVSSNKQIEQAATLEDEQEELDPAESVVPSDSTDSTIDKGAALRKVQSLPVHRPALTNALPSSSSATSFTSLSGRRLDSIAVDSNKFLYAVLWGCVIIELWKHIWILHLLPIPVVYYVVKRAGYYFGVWQLIHYHVQKIYDHIYSWYVERKDALTPAPVRGMGKIMTYLNEKTMASLENSIDPAASIIVILGVLLFTILASIFLAVQIYAEGSHLVMVGSNLINNTVVQNPEIRQLLPDGWDEMVDSMLNKAYLYGREGISNMVRSLIREADEAKAAQLEKQVLDLWDRVYQAWMVSNVDSHFIGPKVPESAVFSSWENLMEGLKKTPGILNIQGLANFAQENVGTLLSVLESVWTILKGNLSLAFNAVTALLSLLFGGGTALLNFFINMVVFMTALFYLLSSSGSLYKPVELITTFSPGNGNKFGVAVEAAVNGVFRASFQMAVFYGLWTWIIHNLFEVNIIYLPSVLAAILGAVPFLGTYWAGIPSTLDLWLGQGDGYKAIFLLLFMVLPRSLVDTAIYAEIKGAGHPYLTGLAIAGGIFCMGVEGAIIGPLLLCCLFVAVNMSSSLMNESPLEPTVPSIGVRQLKRFIPPAWTVSILRKNSVTFFKFLKHLYCLVVRRPKDQCTMGAHSLHALKSRLVFKKWPFK